ncbi:hypothetical protein [Zavarzinella formosa]|uniref:hypothetical protein n=1 Tax=Zavarzinella formosa TaxID=360055 RepID=UPI0002DC2D83|nr:hypothetical protein [Zavarzinella formosa]
MDKLIFAVIGMFVLVWIVSAVMKASQSANPPRPTTPPPNRNRPNQQQKQPEKTTNSDLERFMAEIDKLRTRGEAPPPPQTRPAANPRPPRINQPATARGETPARPRGERRPNNRRSSAPPPLPPKSAEVPVLRPVTPVEPAGPTGGGTAHTLPGFKQAKIARTASSGGGTLREEVSPVMKTLQTILKGDQGPAIAMVLTEIFGEPRCRRKF